MTVLAKPGDVKSMTDVIGAIEKLEQVRAGRVELLGQLAGVGD